MVRQVVVVLSGAFPHRVRQGATRNPLNVNLSGLQISLVAADAPLAAKDGQRDEKQSHQLAPRAATRSSNWDSAGIHMSGTTGGARLCAAWWGIRQQESHLMSSTSGSCGQQIVTGCVPEAGI